MADIVISRLCKRYGSTVALQDFSARFPGGSTTCIMGRSGCGKTTLLHILMGLVKADSGTVTGLPDTMAAVFQEDRLLEDFSPLQNLVFVCPALPREQLLRHLTAVGLKEAAHQPVRELSGGMKRRVAIARAVCAGRPLLILDEPFKGLDTHTRARVSDYLKQHTQNTTVIMVTHDPEEVPLMGGAHLVMEPHRPTGGDL